MVLKAKTIARPYLTIVFLFFCVMLWGTQGLIMSEERKKLSKADRLFLGLLVVGSLSMLTSHNIIYRLAYGYGYYSKLEAEKAATERATKAANNAFQYGLYMALFGLGGSVRIKRK